MYPNTIIVYLELCYDWRKDTLKKVAVLKQSKRFNNHFFVLSNQLLLPKLYSQNKQNH